MTDGRPRPRTLPYTEVLAVPGQAPLDLIDRPGFDTGLARRLHELDLIGLSGLIEALAACRRSGEQTLARVLLERGVLTPELARLLLQEVAGRLTPGAADPTLRSSLPRMADPAAHASGELAGDPWTPGAQVGPYRLLERIGIGGMGLVFRAQHSTSGAQVALKTFRLDADPELKARFHREYEAQRRLDHPNLIPVLERGAQEGRPWFVMELAEGGDLGSRLRREGSLPPLEAARITRDLARGLEHAHDQGVLHRDVKPANVLFDAAGVPKLVDLGIAKLVGAESLTLSGDLLGTPAYMSPEQGLGERDKIGPRSDVYSLGVVLYRLLTGEVPFRAENPMALIAAVATATPRAPADLDPELPVELSELCMQLLEKEPADRMSARELGRRLDGFMHGEAPPSAVAPALAPRTRNAVAVAGFVLFVLGLGLGVWHSAGAPAPPRATLALTPELESPPARAPAPEPSYPLALTPGPQGLYRLEVSSRSEFTPFGVAVTELELDCALDLRLVVREVDGRQASLEATVDALKFAWKLDSERAMDPSLLDPLSFDSQRELDREHPLLRALGERFTFQVDMQTGAIDGVTGSLAILDKTLASLDPLQTARLRVPLFDPTVLRDVLEHLTHALPDEPHLPRTWSLLRGQLRLLRRQGAAAELSVGPTLEPPEVEVVFERNLDEPVGRLGVDGRGRASATRSGLRWTPVGVPNPEEKEFDLRSTLELASRLSHARGRLEAATLEQRWEQERTYRLPGDAARERKALSFGRESFSLRRLSD